MRIGYAAARKPYLPGSRFPFYLEEIVVGRRFGAAQRLTGGGNAHNGNAHAVLSFDPVDSGLVRVAVQDELSAMFADDLLETADTVEPFGCVGGSAHRRVVYHHHPKQAAGGCPVQ